MLSELKAMDIKAERNLLIERVKQIEDSSLLETIKHLLDYALKDKEERTSIEQYNRELDEANARMDAGEYISHEDFKKQL